MWKRQINYGPMISTTNIVRLASISEQAFIRAMCEEILPAIPVVDTGAIVISWQELVKEEMNGWLGGDTYLWRIYWHGFHRPALVKKEAERILESVRDKVVKIGICTTLNVSTSLRDRWVLRQGQWTIR